MKTKQILLTSAIALIAFLICSSFYQQDQNKYLLVKSVECWSGMVDSYIMTIDENGKTEHIELEKFRPKNISNNAIKLNEVINKVANKGYELHSTTGTGDANFIIKDYYFIKK